MSTITSQMNLVIPAIGDSDYPGSISTSFNLIDAHDHTTTKGVQIPTAGIANAAVTRAKLSALGQQVSFSCASFTTASTSFVDVTNLSVSITTTGRPVYVAMISDGSGFESSVSAVVDTTGSGGVFRFVRGATEIATYSIYVGNGVNNSVVLIGTPSSPIFIDVVAAGTYTYKVQLKTTSSIANLAGIHFYKLIAYEL